MFMHSNILYDYPHPQALCAWAIIKIQHKHIIDTQRSHIYTRGHYALLIWYIVKYMCATRTANTIKIHSVVKVVLQENRLVTKMYPSM